MSSADSSSPRVVTLELIRKRSEHNEGMVSNLEEIALHQEELEALGPILGRTCGKTLRILLLQNNVISKIAPSDFRHFKAIEYLNLALNNVEVVEGIQHLEFLNKLDLTLNFIDVDRLEESVEHMKNLRSLKELFLMGNTCCVQIDKDSNRSDDEIDFDPDIPYRRKSGWRGCRMYVVASLTQLSSFDGIFITRSERIKATQKLPLLTAQLRNLAKLCRAYKEDQKLSDYTNNKNDKCEKDEESLTSHTPQSRSEMSKELSIQKAEKLEMERANQPKTRGEKEFEMEQEAAIKKARERELKGSIKQCNEGKWNYRFDEEKKPGFLLLDVPLPKFLSSSLIDVDIHPTFISIVVKSKILRLLLPSEVISNDSTAQRSTITGHLLILMPKVNTKKNIIGRSLKKSLVSKNKIQKSEKSKRISDLLLEATQQSVQPNSSVKDTEFGLKEMSSKKLKDTDQVQLGRQKSPDEDASDGDPPPIF